MLVNLVVSGSMVVLDDLHGKKMAANRKGIGPTMLKGGRRGGREGGRERGREGGREGGRERERERERERGREEG